MSNRWREQGAADGFGGGNWDTVLIDHAWEQCDSKIYLSPSRDLRRVMKEGELMRLLFNDLGCSTPPLPSLLMSSIGLAEKFVWVFL